MPLVRYLTLKKNPNVMIPTQGHRVDDHGSIFRAFYKPTREERKARVAALKAKRRGE